MATQPTNNNDNKKYIIIGCIVCVIVVCVIGYFNSKKPDQTETEKTTETEQVQTNEAGGYTLTQIEAEEYCQDANLISQYFNLQKIDIYASAFKVDQPKNAYVPDMFAYDKDGNSIVYVTWKGWDKTTDEAIDFSCYVSGSDKNSITLHMLRVIDYQSGQEAYLYGDGHLEQYDKNGELIPKE